MIGISDALIRRNVFGQPQQAMEQGPEGVGANHRKRGVYGGDGLLDNLIGPLVERVAGFVGGVLQPVVPLMDPLVGFIVAGVRDAQERSVLTDAHWLASQTARMSMSYCVRPLRNDST